MIELYWLKVVIFFGHESPFKTVFFYSSNSKTSKNGDSYLVNLFFRMIVLISFLVLTSEVNLHYLHDADLTKSLKLSGDVELNPGPYEIVRTVQGNFNEGNVALLGGSAGWQCACNALFPICWSVVHEISLWKTIDLEFILVEDDKLYKSLDFQGYLNVG